jgi:hypothetical protein
MGSLSLNPSYGASGARISEAKSGAGLSVRQCRSRVSLALNPGYGGCLLLRPLRHEIRRDRDHVGVVGLVDHRLHQRRPGAIAGAGLDIVELAIEVLDSLSAAQTCKASCLLAQGNRVK